MDLNSENLGFSFYFYKTKLKNICLSLSEKFTKFATINCDFLFTLRPFTTFQLFILCINNIK